MLGPTVERAIRKAGLDAFGTKMSSAIHDAILAGGEPTRNVADLLHGTWLGHPLHPVLTDIVVGSFSLATLFDGIAAVRPSHQAEYTADTLLTIGAISAVPTALAGMTDYSGIQEPATGTGLAHALLNSTALVLYLLSIRARRNEQRGMGVVLSTVAFGILMASSWLGGHMINSQRVGVNHNDEYASGPKEWTAALSEDQLHEQQPLRVEVEEQPVLLYRRGGTVYAIGAVCAHAGGPLEEGKFDGLCVECPWHQSVFDLRDGSIVHGPTTYPQPKYAARIQNGQVEVRLQRRS
jgi:nitrite reductase/ring-hydroxylating ferredoxin subunit/uncharacterized membrane protein